MKKYFCYLIIFILFSFSNNPVWARQEKSIGLGITLGDLTGPTFKYWLNKKNAIDFGIGFHKDTVIYGSFLWQKWDLFKKIKNGILGGYIGVGARIENKKNDDKMGLRTTAGLNYWFDKHPIELFFEIAPIFQISPETDTEFDILLGVRFYL